MHYLTIASFLLSTALLTSAAPTPTSDADLVPRACSTLYPDIARVEQARPVESYLPGFIVAQDAGATNIKDAFAEFTVPPSSYGCQLEVYFPAGYPINTWGANQVYVYSLDGPLSRSPRGIDVSWAYGAPNIVSQVGTVTFGSKPNEPTRVVINSFQCRPKMAFRFSIASENQAGYVEFVQSQAAGLRMTYNC
ncbi:hypothetical protein H2199_005423 [Coniosporium tulheliwenetii]|uniref:Uncharacterized protein n=1 Tax=Coniosporium tulheliwenetii TaxID=3383036 RepID=A0ACC2Z1A7_9PEZI|nr:hypothetical protein H2199_005423 [Cladosporium sp. JES 115]